MPPVRSRLLPALAAMAVAASAAGCSSATEGRPLEPGSVLFEAEYVNFAWVPTWRGFYVDQQGSVIRYRLENPRPRGDSGDTFTEEQLREKYRQNAEVLKTLDAAEVAARYQRVGEAIDGTITDPHFRCADAGTVRFSAMVYVPSSGTYRRVLLRVTGDYTQRNLTPAGEELFAWLRQVDPQMAALSSLCEP